jgi:hypothetical protein
MATGNSEIRQRLDEQIKLASYLQRTAMPDQAVDPGFCSCQTRLFGGWLRSNGVKNQPNAAGALGDPSLKTSAANAKVPGRS